MGHSHSGRSSGAGKANKMFRTNVGSKNRRTYGNPSRVLATEEIVGGVVLLLLHHPHNDTYEGQEEDSNDNPVK